MAWFKEKVAYRGWLLAGREHSLVTSQLYSHKEKTESRSSGCFMGGPGTPACLHWVALQRNLISIWWLYWICDLAKTRSGTGDHVSKREGRTQVPTKGVEAEAFVGSKAAYLRLRERAWLLIQGKPNFLVKPLTFERGMGEQEPQV